MAAVTSLERVTTMRVHEVRLDDRDVIGRKYIVADGCGRGLDDTRSNCEERDDKGKIDHSNDS